MVKAYQYPKRHSRTLYVARWVQGGGIDHKSSCGLVVVWAWVWLAGLAGVWGYRPTFPPP